MPHREAAIGIAALRVSPAATMAASHRDRR
jgi:hypothetical protein